MNSIIMKTIKIQTNTMLCYVKGSGTTGILLEADDYSKKNFIQRFFAIRNFKKTHPEWAEYTKWANFVFLSGTINGMM